MFKIISERDFRSKVAETLVYKEVDADYVTGAGRSGAIAAVYVSHVLGMPFIPYKCIHKDKKVLIVDTATFKGRTKKKACNLYKTDNFLAFYHQETLQDRLKFWYEELSITRGKGNEYKNNEAWNR